MQLILDVIDPRHPRSAETARLLDLETKRMQRVLGDYQGHRPMDPLDAIALVTAEIAGEFDL